MLQTSMKAVTDALDEPCIDSLTEAQLQATPSYRLVLQLRELGQQVDDELDRLDTLSAQRR